MHEQVDEEPGVHDERARIQDAIKSNTCDIYQSTMKACKYLQWLYAGEVSQPPLMTFIK